MRLPNPSRARIASREFVRDRPTDEGFTTCAQPNDRSPALNVPPPKTSMASPGGSIVPAAKICRTDSVELLIERVRTVQPVRLIAVSVELANSTNSSCEESREPSWLASPSMPAGGSAYTSLKTIVVGVTLRLALPVTSCELALMVD